MAGHSYQMYAVKKRGVVVGEGLNAGRWGPAPDCGELRHSTASVLVNVGAVDEHVAIRRSDAGT